MAAEPGAKMNRVCRQMGAMIKEVGIMGEHFGQRECLSLLLRDYKNRLFVCKYARCVAPERGTGPIGGPVSTVLSPKSPCSRTKL